MKLSHLLAVSSLASFVHAQYPTPYCTAGVSSNLCVPQIAANVQPNVANTAGCVINVSDVPGNRMGVTFYGVDNAGFTPSPWGGPGWSSLLCVKAPTLRIGAAQHSGGTAGACNGSYLVNWDAFQSANPSALGNPWVAGDKAYVQAWYRDPLAVKASNLSNAVELTFREPPPVPCVTTIPGMVQIPLGTFTMGYQEDPNATGPEQPIHQVTFSSCFWMGQTEVTQAQYLAVMGTNPSYFPGSNSPVEMVSWFDARAYCAALTAQETAWGRVPPGYEYRLPTEAEWEYACRAGTTTQYNLGDTVFCNQARITYSAFSVEWCNPMGALPVGSYAPNAWGLFDMHGNVGEWCLDSWAFYSPGAVTHPFVTGGIHRVVRGGAWDETSFKCRSAYRMADQFPTYAYYNRGFRVVLGPIVVP